MTGLWVLRASMLPDEILSSWLVRAALVQGCDPLVLTGALWPEWRAWTQDIDRGLTAGHLRTLTKKLAAEPSTFEAATLRPAAETVTGGQLGTAALWPWILFVGSRNRLRRGGMQFCPQCLADDHQPFYRRQWRLAWHTGCARHRTMLLGACPCCTAPLEPHRLTIYDAGLASCASCRHNLRLSWAAPALSSALAFQIAADECISGLPGSFGEEDLTCPGWFALARYLVVMLRRVAGDRHDGLTALVTGIGVDIGSLSAPATGLAFEFLPAIERAPLLAAAWTMLNAGPITFLDAALRSGVAANAFNDHRTPVPACLETIIAQLVVHGRLQKAKSQRMPAAPASRSQIVRQWARLRRIARAAQTQAGTEFLPGRIVVKPTTVG